MRLPVAPSAVTRLSLPSPRGAMSAAVHTSVPLVIPDKLVRLLYKLRQTN
jgi:hypothetical protein